ncbi:DnaB-like replicative helicase [Rhizobium phage vB_RleS_L338C]|uniref:DnaB-like replicative helicase n=1 Tax=Rhizobium phage vB_RleS_L338C TaxID=1414737 RepID=UPI0003D83DC6|nr:DnaB-like replicative helicase [Rhizobium phage vB_RleS_L338C]AHC30474.1 replicative DNA helicase [Rhizobium phage vB_RleS_L338C]QNH72049.1 DNA helicase [Rhizobium phage P11VFA]
MSIGLQLVRAAIEGGSREALRQVPITLFTPDELPRVQFVVNHISNHGALPSIQICTENGITFPGTNGGNFSYFMTRLRQRAITNSATAGAQGLLAAIRARNDQDIVSIVENMHGQMTSVSQNESTMPITNAIQAAWQEYHEARANPGMRGITTGFSVLDRVTAGLRPGDVTTIVARPGVGKSWTILNMALRAWLAGNSVCFVSMEMTAIETARRLIGMATGVNPDFISRGTVSHWAEDNVEQWIATVPGRPPFILMVGDLSKSVQDVDYMIMEYEPDICYVDASYLLKPTEGNMFRGKRWESAQQVAEGIKGVALKRHRHIVQTVQFNRSQTVDEEMSLDNIGGTDAYAQISSLAMGIRIGAAPNERRQRRYGLLKNRHGIDWLTFETNFIFDPFNMDVLGSNLPADLDTDVLPEDAPDPIPGENFGHMENL